MALALSTIGDLIVRSLSKFITVTANDCGYNNFFTEVFVTAFFSKLRSKASKEDNPFWHQAMSRQFADKYWKGSEKEMSNLECMGACDVVEGEDGMNVFNGTWIFKYNNFKMKS